MQLRESPTPQSLRAIQNLTVGLRKTYEDWSHDSRFSARKSQNLLDEIGTETSAIYGEVWHLAAEQCTNVRKQADARQLLQDFEAHVIPNIFQAALACFKTFCKDRRLAPEGHAQLLYVLNVMLAMCTRIYNLKTEGYVQGRFSSPHLRLPLNRIIKTLEAGDLERCPLDVDNNATGNGPESSSPWTEDQGLVLK